ncbi:MAG: hypothetical protein PUD20_01190 [bacterium]|nr:hypothetical protein [bacterium]
MQVVLIVTVLFVFGFGYFLTRRLDSFLHTDDSELLTDMEIKQPSYVMLTDDVTDETILEEIHHFRRTHEHMEIYLICSVPSQIRRKNA